MATKSIGSSGRDYATIQLWAAYVNALALSAPEVGECYNDSEFTITGTKVTIGGWTGGSGTNTVTLKCAAGQSFRDNASVLSNALRYNQSNGVGITSNVNDYGPTLLFTTSFTTIDGLQIKTTAANSRPFDAATTGPPDHVTLQNCIFQGKCISNNWMVSVNGNNSVVANILIINNAAVGSTGGGLITVLAPTVTDVTILSTGTTTKSGLNATYGSPVVANTAVAGFVTDYQGTASAASANNATDQSSFGGTGFGTTGGQVSLVPGTEWQNASATTEDLRVNSSTSVKLKGNGATAGPGTDIAATTRVAPYTIGCWQVANNNLTISPSVGNLALTGQQPAVITARLATPSPGAMALTGLLFTFNLGVAVATPSAGSLAITGQAPVVTVTTNLAISPTTGALAIVGQAPIVTIGASQFSSPSAGALVLAGQAPGVTIGSQIFVTLAAGSLALIGNAPVVTTQSNLPVGPSVTENIRAAGGVTSIRAVRGVSGILAIAFTPTES